MNEQGRVASGFTLIEVLISLTILSIALAALLGVFGVNLDRLRQSQAETTAVALTQSLLDELGATVPIRLGESSGQFERGYRWRLHIEPYGSDEDRKAWPATPVVVSASTFWDGDRKSVTLTTLRLTSKDGR